MSIIPDDDDPPLPLDVPEDLHNTVVYLSLPTRRPGTMEAAGSAKQKGLARYITAEDEVRDTNAGMENVAPIQVGKLSMRLLFGSDQRDEYACMGVVRIVESRADKSIILDGAFLPPLLDCQAAPTIVGFLKELQGLLHHRGEGLAERVSASGRGGGG